ncbi:MAG: CoA ester lyase [Myxococcales bacterium]|nr:CoA ester lyase [Myxococcales bacterium]MDD9965784.1 CoA ester lyase [Myxococcales bacterium]
MVEQIRPRRSVLYMPGSNARALEKAKTIPADALILDLEDAVGPDKKDLAREQVCAAARSGEYGHREIAIRINGLDTAWGREDLAAACAASPDAILVPKIDGASMIRQIGAAMEAAGAPDKTKMWAMLETPRGVLRSEEIAGASPRLEVLVMGTNDIAKEVRCAHRPGRAPMMTSLGLCLLAARAHAKTILDGVYNDIKDAEGFEAECVQGAELGFDGKTLIHPNQVEVCNRAYAPSQEEVAQAREIIAAFQQAREAGKFVVTVGGRMIENLHVEQAKRAVALAEAIERSN